MCSHTFSIRDFSLLLYELLTDRNHIGPCPQGPTTSINSLQFYTNDKMDMDNASKTVIQSNSNSHENTDSNLIHQTNKSLNQYTSIHQGPFLVIVQNSSGNVGNLHPMKLGKISLIEGISKLLISRKLTRINWNCIFERI